MKKESIEKHLQCSVLFQDLSPEEIGRCSEMAMVEIVPMGEYVYRQGGQTDLLYLVAVGEAELVFEFDTSSVSAVGRVGPGGHFGETALLTGKPHAVAVRALFDLVLLIFKGSFFKDLLERNQCVRRRVDLFLAERLRVAFADQADMSRKQIGRQDITFASEMVLFRQRGTANIDLEKASDLNSGKNEYVARTSRRTHAEIDRIASNQEPFFLNGEEGTGRTIIAKQIHLQSICADAPYREIDLREYPSALLLEKKLFGAAQDTYPFFQTQQAGFFEKTCGGTLVFCHVELLPISLQEKLLKVIASSVFTHLDSKQQIAMQSRLVFISDFSLTYLRNSGKIIPEFLAILERQKFTVPAVREHKKDLPQLIDHYLKRFSREYGKEVTAVSPETLGVLMNYDWPGNLTELSTVIRRAVMLAATAEVHAEEILLGLPKSEGKWEFNLLRFPWVRSFITSKRFPQVPQIVIGGVLLLAVFVLFFGPRSAEANLGLTISWSIGWPLMFFSFFFLARIWCSVCSLAMPGMLLQNIFPSKRKTPAFIKKNSGWLMAILCVLVFWVEIVWDAYENPLLTGMIILTITFGSIIFSLLYSRRTWCRYLCPLGAVNAIFAMPSILELRSNKDVCLNKCQDHACYAGGEESDGCPMFRHPYLVDNNRDCIICGECVKNCNNSAVQLNLRIAPQELWSLQTPRLADSFLIVALGAIFFPFALHTDFVTKARAVLGQLEFFWGVNIPYGLGATLIFFLLILFAFSLYYGMATAQARFAGGGREKIAALLGYGFIPVVLGAYLAIHLEIFVVGAGRLIPQLEAMMGWAVSYENWQLMNDDSTLVLQVISIFGGLFASMYAIYRIIERLLEPISISSRALVLPYSFLLLLTISYLSML
ncbi:sigma 54-interacting transcriptional regulator [Desulfotalea psychrophila]|uniref:Related to nitrogen assimilation regulatory protein n=1 Tax=Desulfotalea psychrophila (strain LSv54 / DSM 12343) TaxID=177439 RepID=Q6ANR0_DESPS|nr:sigma 54-interacting transcriptional regulator [Desulfotalea psychrophila]CAG36014.1 related to nitrogen assimilation regulatory protein [Desulfotalea psychrophila LSv54]